MRQLRFSKLLGVLGLGVAVLLAAAAVEALSIQRAGSGAPISAFPLSSQSLAPNSLSDNLDALEGDGIISATAGLVLHMVPSLDGWAIASLISVLIAASLAMLLFDPRRASQMPRFEFASASRKPSPLLGSPPASSNRRVPLRGRRAKPADSRRTTTHTAPRAIERAPQRAPDAGDVVIPIDPVKLLLTRIIHALVDDVDHAVITQTVRDHTHVFVIDVVSSDVGKVLGRKGANIFAIRTLLTAISGRTRRRYSVEVVERGKVPRPTSSRPRRS